MTDHLLLTGGLQLFEAGQGCAQQSAGGGEPFPEVVGRHLDFRHAQLNSVALPENSCPQKVWIAASLLLKREEGHCRLCPYHIAKWNGKGGRNSFIFFCAIFFPYLYHFSLTILPPHGFHGFCGFGEIVSDPYNQAT